MQYYTKDWYNLMQRQHYTSNLTPVPDRIYTDKDIQSFYQQDLDAFLESERACHDDPPSIRRADDLLMPETFDPESFLFTNETKTDDGYEVHILISTRHGQKYLTIGCADITVENNLPLCKED